MRRTLLPILTVILLFCSCGNRGVRVSSTPFPKLSDYQLFIGELKALNPAEGVLPYDLISPLFSDYAHKSRFVWMPETSNAKFIENEVFDFPIGTLLIKTFYYGKDERNISGERNLLETRILQNKGLQWEAFNYIWNDEQTEAYLDIIGDIKAVEWIDHGGSERQVDYIIPNKNQCKACHSNKGILKPIGPKAQNLYKDFTYSEGSRNQMDKWTEIGYLTGYDKSKPPKTFVALDDNNEDIHKRAISYLDINCAHCHNPDGPANTSGLNLGSHVTNGLEMGIWKSPVAAGAGSGGRLYNIVPGRPEESIFTYRMESINPAEMMPELGRRLVHKEGLALIDEWIREMKVQ